jgi:hypothetical protein
LYLQVDGMKGPYFETLHRLADPYLQAGKEVEEVNEEEDEEERETGEDSEEEEEEVESEGEEEEEEEEDLVPSPASASASSGPANAASSPPATSGPGNAAVSPPANGGGATPALLRRGRPRTGSKHKRKRAPQPTAAELREYKEFQAWQRMVRANGTAASPTSPQVNQPSPLMGQQMMPHQLTPANNPIAFPMHLLHQHQASVHARENEATVRRLEKELNDSQMQQFAHNVATHYRGLQ